MELLIVEDDAVIGKSLQRGFQEAGHHCTWTNNGREALELAQTHPYDAITLDIMLPELSGLEILRRLRGERNHTPVVLVTARGSVEERVTGLAAGADDYLVKPFAFVELMARIEAVCRRTTQRATPTTQVGELRLDMSTRRVMYGAREIELTPTEFSLLEFLMRHSGRCVTRKMLCEHLWEQDWDGMTNVIDVHINRLRNKLDRVCPQPMIDTVRGRGYALRAHD